MSDTVFDYAVAMGQAVDELQEFAVSAVTELPPELARAVCLAVTHARWGQVGLGDEALDQRMRLDWLAAHEYGGYHGYGFDVIEDWAEEIAHTWTNR